MPEFERTWRLLGLKYLPFLPIETYFKDLKNFFIRLFKKFRGSIVSFYFIELRAERSTTLTGFNANT
jgi:hypothetical protein